jgi:hypothetical protein
MGSVILYETKRRISLTLEGTGAFLNRNMAMHDPDFLVFKESQTEIEFIIRNIDRKPINLTNRKIFATLVNYYSGVTMAVIPLTIVDAVRGIARMTFLPYMVKDIPQGFHRYTISYMLDNGNHRLLAMDQYEKAHGYFEMRYGRELQGIKSQEATFESFSPENSTRYDTYWVSPNFEGNLRNGSLAGLHTFAWYAENFTGSIWMEGSIVETAPDQPDWFPILVDGRFEHKLDHRSGILAYNVESNLQWARFKIKPEFPDNDSGKVVKILFRN